MAEVVFPMPGKVVSVDVAVGDSVTENQQLCVFEAMKIEMPLASTTAGTIKEIKAATDEMVEAEQVFCIID